MSQSITEGDLDKLGGEHEYLEGSGTPTPSEKVSRWHRDIFLVSPPGGGTNGNAQQVHPRQCLCDQCMAEYGTFKFYNDMLNGKDKAGKVDDPGNKTVDSDEPMIPTDVKEKKRSIFSAVRAGWPLFINDS